MLSQNPNRWLLLEQGEHAGDWGVPIKSTLHFLILSPNVTPSKNSQEANTASSSEICIAFLPRNKESSLPPHLKKAGALGWQIWCHFGGNILPSDVRKEWGKYPRLDADDKRELLPTEAHPLPFSKSQTTLGGYQMMEDFRALVREVLKPDNDLWTAADHANASQSLKQAWDKLEDQRATDILIERSHETLPLVMAAHRMLTFIPIQSTALEQVVRCLVNQFDDSPLPWEPVRDREALAVLALLRAEITTINVMWRKVADARNSLVSAVRDAKERFGTLDEKAKRSGNPEDAIAPDHSYAPRIKIIRRALWRFIAASNRLSRAATAALLYRQH